MTVVRSTTGEIGFSSQGENKGSTFWFAVPLPVARSEPSLGAFSAAIQANTFCPIPEPNGTRPASAPSSRSTSPTRRETDGKCWDQHLAGLKVLLVEDNAVNQRVGRRLLERIGCDVHVAENGLVCLGKLEQESYDIIFMDCQMPILGAYPL